MAKKPASHTTRNFRALVYEHDRRTGRTLPWRKRITPYRILVSEIMLQQTQVDRVIPKFSSFVRRFPTIRTLADAPLGDVVSEWQGLGYNRRAKMLHQCAKVACEEYGGRLPKTYEELLRLPGIGPYTAAAILVFAHNIPRPLIETNVRSVYIHHFFKNAATVHDKDIMPLIEATLDQRDPRRWYAALMDYGSVLKKEVENPSRKSAAHRKQSRFEGSSRQARGAIIRALTTHGALTKRQLAFISLRDDVSKELATLARDGLIVKEARRWRLR